MLPFQADFYERLFKSMDENAVLMQVEKDGTYYPVWCSLEFTHMMECTEAEFIRMESGGTMNTIHPDDRDDVAYLFRRHCTRDGSNTLTVRKRTAKGRQIWVRIHYAFVRDNDGTQYAYCTYSDITAEKERERVAEIARRERESLRVLHGLLNSGPWYMDFNEAGEMVRVTWSGTFRQMVGYKNVNDFPNRLESWSDLLHPEDKERVLNRFNEVIRDKTGQEVYDVQYRLLTKDRGWRWFHAIGQLTRRPDGSPVTYVGMFVDITEQKALEEKVAEQQHSLRSALDAANQANAAKTSFLSTMSHEIRTPMNAIIGLDSIALKEPDLSPRTREQLEKIGGSARHLLSLINDILDMSRIESGRMVLKNEEFSFRDMLDQINSMIHSQCQTRGLEYNCVIEGSVDAFYIGDDMKLRQVLINILGNAVKFTPPPGTVTFTVEQTARYEDQSTLCFTVTDTGIGMEQSYLSRIFEPFSQEDGATTTSYGGTGLGMALSKNIVDAMNGSISVKSERGKGSTFTVRVPLRNSSRTDRPAAALPPQELRVLIVDDDPVACEHAALVLSEVGIAADTCNDGEEAMRRIALRHARREAYNLILVDLRMPGDGGMEVSRKIREKYHDESTIVILTAYAWDDIIDEAVSAGVDSFMAKPLFASDVVAEFNRIIQRRQAREKEKPRRAELKGRRVLLAEDMEINAEIMMEVLGMREILSEHAENGRIAVEMFAGSEPGYFDAVLMDVRMPEMDGLQAAAAIRALNRPDAKTVPIIALTANAFDEDVQRSLQAGMNAHLTKPVEPERLFRTLEELIPDNETNE